MSSNVWHSRVSTTAGAAGAPGTTTGTTLVVFKGLIGNNVIMDTPVATAFTADGLNLGTRVAGKYFLYDETANKQLGAIKDTAFTRSPIGLISADSKDHIFSIRATFGDTIAADQDLLVTVNIATLSCIC